MVECCEQLRFACEAGDSVGILCDGRRQHLEGDLASQLGITRPVDLAHPASTEGGEDFVRAKMGSGSKAHGLTPQIVALPRHAGVRPWAAVSGAEDREQ